MIRPIAQSVRSQLDFEGLWKWLVLGTAVGLVVGPTAILFQILLQTLSHFALSGIVGLPLQRLGGEDTVTLVGRAEEFSPLMLLLVPTLGGLLAGFLVRRFAPEAKGHGTDAAIAAFHRRQGEIRWRVPIVKFIASVVTLSSGGSGGREGPIAQIGGGIGSLVATRLKLSAKTRRALLAAGMAAGVGAIFRAPLAGAIFAAEVLYSGMDIEMEALLPSAVASIVSYSVFAAWGGFHPMFSYPKAAGFANPLELVAYLVLGLVVGLGALLYVKVFYGIADFFGRLRLSPYLQPAVGGLLTGLVGLALIVISGDFHVRAVVGVGYGVLQQTLSSDAAGLTVSVLLFIAFGKMLTSALTIGSGGSAGVFGPSMVIGGSLGAAVGLLLHQISPALAPHPSAFMVVGMAGFFAAAAKTPLSTMIMVSELTGDYQLLVPSLWVCTVAFLVGRRWTIYRNQVPFRRDSPAHLGDLAADALAGATVATVFKRARPFRLIPAELGLREILAATADGSQRIFPVVDGEQRLLGAFRLSDLNAVVQRRAGKTGPVCARDVIAPGAATIRSGARVGEALKIMDAEDVEELLVVDDADPRSVIGIMANSDVFFYYSREISRAELAPAEDAADRPRR